MALDISLMTNEFMHGFGDCMNGLRDSSYEMVFAVERFDLLPKKYQEVCRKMFVEKDKTQFDRRVSSFCEFSEDLQAMIDLVARKRQTYSESFKLIQIFAKILDRSRQSFEEYLGLQVNDKKAFLPYVPNLENAVNSIEGITIVRSLYDSVVDGRVAREVWARSNSGWKASPKSIGFDRKSI
jgi:hypothetical protein